MVEEVNGNFQDVNGEHVVSLRELVPERQKDGVVMVTFTDMGYIDSFYLSNELSHLQSYSNLVVVAIEISAYIELKEKGFPVAFFNITSLAGRVGTAPSLFGTNVFKQKMNAKQRIIREVLLLNCSCLLFDSDVILHKNPLPGILLRKHYDMLAQKDERVNSGFVFFRPTLTSIHFLNHVIRFMPVWGLSDQPTTNRLIDENRVPAFRWGLLPEEEYSSGLVFFAKHQFRWDAINATQVTIHNNYILGEWNKMYRLKEMGLYRFDKNREYSDTTATFLYLQESRRGFENRSLALGVELANRLNRSFVVPILPCSNEVQLSKCNLCGNQFRFCHHDILQNATLPWKEHVISVNNPHQ
ncbi:hypothetical protein WA577_004076 [Blastocystis sp. JDR]